jgi:hypothetical protein
VKRLPSKWISLGMAASLTLGVGVTARAIDLGDAVKVFGVGWAVKQFGGQINKFLNTILAQNKAVISDATKVVPIISIGSGGYIGAAQVMGPESALKNVKAVGQGELGLSGVNARVKGLFPINTTNPLKGVSRVQGVGVSAIIDLKI